MPQMSQDIWNSILRNSNLIASEGNFQLKPNQTLQKVPALIMTLISLRKVLNHIYKPV